MTTLKTTYNYVLKRNCDLFFFLLRKNSMVTQWLSDLHEHLNKIDIKSRFGCLNDLNSYYFQSVIDNGICYFVMDLRICVLTNVPANMCVWQKHLEALACF